MSRTILVPHDGSSHAQAALTYTLETFPNARVVLFHAIDPYESPSEEDQFLSLTEEWFHEKQAEANDLFEEARDGVNEGDATIEAATAVGSPPHAIVAALEDTDIDQIVMGNRGRGVAQARLGSTAELVLRRADVPVTVVR